MPKDLNIRESVFVETLMKQSAHMSLHFPLAHPTADAITPEEATQLIQIRI